MPTIRILLVTNVGDASVADALAGDGHEMTAVADVPAAIDVPGPHDVVVLDLAGAIDAAVAASGAIRSSAQLAGLPIICVSPTDEVEDRIRLLEAGVDDVIARPFDPRELDARTEALALRVQRTRDIAAGGVPVAQVRDAAQRRVIAVYSPKGGVGTTTVAVNVATWLAMHSGLSIAILDFDFQFGQVATHLNMTTRMTVTDLVRDEVAQHDVPLFRATLDRHSSGLMVLAAPNTPEDAGVITEAGVISMLAIATQAFEVVVVDAGSALDRRSETILTRATDLVIVVTPEFPALKAVHALLELLASSGEGIGETSYVLNSIFARELLRLRDIEDALGTKIALTLPYDAFAFLKSVNEGVPVVEGSPRTAAAAAFGRLATLLGGLHTEGAVAQRKARGLGAMFGRG